MSLDEFALFPSLELNRTPMGARIPEPIPPRTVFAQRFGRLLRSPAFQDAGEGVGAEFVECEAGAGDGLVLGDGATVDRT